MKNQRIELKLKAFILIGIVVGFIQNIEPEKFTILIVTYFSVKLLMTISNKRDTPITQ